MGRLKSINQNPRLTKYFVNLKIFNQDKLAVLDVGARGGFEKHWILYQDQVNIIGFDADPEECDRLNKKSVERIPPAKYYPYALEKEIGKKKFYITKHIASSSFYKPNLYFLKRFPDLKNLLVKKETILPTTSLDDALKRESIGKIDIIKIDTEGNELNILKGAEKTLKKVLAISIEVAFLRLRLGQPTFSEIDQYLQSKGFRLYDLSLNRIARKSLSTQLYTDIPVATSWGQVLWGQAVYLRDLNEEITKGNKRWGTNDVLKQVSFMELINLPDCAIELLQTADSKKMLKGYRVSELIDLLIPPLDGKYLTYNDFKDKLMRDYQKLQEMSVFKEITTFLKSLVPLSLRKNVYMSVVNLQNKFVKRS